MADKTLRYLRIPEQEARDFADALGSAVYTCDRHIQDYIRGLRETLGGLAGDWVVEEPLPALRGDGEPPCDLSDEGQVIVQMFRDLKSYFEGDEAESQAAENIGWLERRVRSLAIEAGKPLP